MNLFVANWKMNMLRADAAAYAAELSRRIGQQRLGMELVLAPPYTSLDAARDRQERWGLAGQDVAAERQGAFTGEVSARMLADAGCRYAVIGHSERRRFFGENDALLAAKLARAREAGLVPIYCLGETEAERLEGASDAVLARQVETLREDPAEASLVVAYEPVWAIGTGRAATPEDCATASVHLRRLLAGRRSLRLLYGGSVTGENCADLLGQAGVDGFLIGGASLNVASFATIAGLE
jgi:triosephosphate isomerase (TIM)